MKGRPHAYFFWAFVPVSVSDLANLRRDRCIVAILLDRFAVIVPDWIQNYVVLDRRVACRKRNSKIKMEHKEMYKKIKYRIICATSWFIIIATARIFIILIRSNVPLRRSLVGRLRRTPHDHVVVNEHL